MSDSSVIELGGRRELFVDDAFVSMMSEGVTRRLHQPAPDQIVLTLDAPHEDCNCAGSYDSIVYDGTRYLYYYRAGGRQPSPARPKGVEDYVLCVAETTDGIHFRRCEVNLFASGPNVVLDSTKTRHLVPPQCKDVCPAVTTVFYDTNPDCPKDERYKMIVTNERPPASDARGMFLFVSSDGFDFHQKTEKFQLDKSCGYDSANRAFYDPSIGEYRLYSRAFKMAGPDWKRTIFLHTTPDFIHFTSRGILQFDAEFEALFPQGQELYTNNIAPYFRAPHILLGFPMRYVEWSRTTGLYATVNDWDEGILSRPNVEARAFSARISPRYGLAATDTVLITSRDGEHFQGNGESFLAAPPQDDSWRYGSGSVANGMVVSPSIFGHGAPDELSFYSVEGGWGDGVNRIRRYRLRMDGFASLHFDSRGGCVSTPKFTFQGGVLSLNIATGALGGFQVEIRDERGCPIPGYTFHESYLECGDDLQMLARWKGHGNDVRPLEGRVVQLLIYAKNCDLYSLCFEPYREDPPLPSLVSQNLKDDIQKPQ